LRLAGLIALFVILPLLKTGLPATADTPIHFYRALEFSQSWGPGTLYPRWAPDLAYGYGYPLWVFAPPLPYVIPLLLTTVGASLETGLKGLIILAVLTYALGAYLFARHHLGSKAGLIAAAIYTLAPFALREVLLYGGNYPQYLAIGLYPWVLWGLSRIHRRASCFNILLTAALYGAVMLSHLFHVLIFTPVAVGYALMLWISDLRFTIYDLRLDEVFVNRKSKIVNLLASALAMALGLLATAFFWIPAFFERAYTRSTDDVYLAVSPIFSRFLNWGELLAWPQPLDARAANPWVPFSLGMGALFLALLGAVALLRPKRVRPTDPRLMRTEVAGPVLSEAEGSRTRPEQQKMWSAQSRLSLRLQGLFFLALLATTIFMMLSISTPVWTNIPLLAVAEFPWRLLGLANLSLAFLGGASVHLFKDSRKQSWFSLFGVVAVLLSSSVYLYPPRPFVHYDDSQVGMIIYEMATRTIGTTTLGEYLPVWVKDVPATSPIAEEMARGESVEKFDLDSLPDEASAQLLEHTAVSDAYRFDSPAPFQARFHTFYYPGWTAYLDDQSLDIAIEPDSGLVAVPIPAGSHTLRLRFKDTPLRAAANFISLATIVVILIALTGFTSSALAGFVILRLRSGQARRSPSPKTRVADPLRAKSDEKASRCGWPLVWVGGALIALLLFKILLIDSHTDWFRRESPPGQVIEAQHALQNNLDNQFWLLGYDLNRDAARPGQELRVVLYWQAQKPIAADYRSFVHLDAPTNQRTWAASDNFHPGDATAQIDIPTSSWDSDHYIRDEHFLAIPSAAPPVEFLLRAGLYDPDTGQRLPLVGEEGDAVILQKLQVLPSRKLDQPDIPNSTDYRLGDSITLQGFSWDDGRAALTLFWQTKQSLSEDYAAFVHLLDENGQLAWGADGPPLDGLYPTSAWHPHTIIADIRQLDLTDLGPGKYTLAVGLYRPDTLQRLPVTNARGRVVADNAIRLTEVEIKGEK